MSKSASMMERLVEKVVLIPFAGCWIWDGASGRYGKFSFYGKLMDAHRASWLLHHGEIPEGQCVLHECDIPLCVNPSHLFLGTHKQNTLDMVNKGRHGGKHRKDKRND